MILYLVLAFSISSVLCNPVDKRGQLQFENFGKNNIELEKRYTEETSSELFSKFINTLSALLDGGVKELEDILNDPDIKEILEQMDTLIRLLAESLVAQFEDELGNRDLTPKESIEINKRFVKETSTALLKKLVQILLSAYKKGSEYFYKVLDDPDVQGILDHLGPFSKKLADSIIGQFKELVDQIDEATKPKSKRQEKDFKQSSFSLLKKLTHILVKAFEKGSDAFNTALNDPDVKEILNSLNNLSRKAAEVLIQKFKELIIKIDELTDEKPKIERNLLETRTTQVKELIKILVEASKVGPEYFNEVTNSLEFKESRENLGLIGNEIIDSIIAKFVEIFDHVEKIKVEKLGDALLMSDWKNDATVQLKRLVQILLNAYRKGGEYFDKVVSDPDVQNILEHLGPLSRKVANSIIENFKQLIEKIDNATKEESF